MHSGGGGTFVGEISLEITTESFEEKRRDEIDDFEELNSWNLYHDEIDTIYMRCNNIKNTVVRGSLTVVGQSL